MIPKRGIISIKWNNYNIGPLLGFAKKIKV
jgi:hypothetical protein